MDPTLLGYISMGVIGLGLAVVTFILARNPIAERPEFGSRGLQRKRALEESDGFAAVEGAMRVVSGWVSQLPITELRQKLDRKIVYAGDYAGLSANDLIGLSIVSGFGFTLLSLIFVNLAEMTSLIVIFAVLIGFYMPFMQVSGQASARFKAVNRSLPTAIDLASLCMGAGLDFPGALRQIVEKASSNDAVLVGELRRILQELELGHTRRKALEGLAERVPTEAVRDFVSTVVQAEEKGNPLAEVLSIQARMLRMRRSVMAEEAAAKAGMMMMAPLMMMFICIILLLLGPFVVKWTTTGL
ncbi:MAG: type II secretion system F family protein [Myxococcales bacterium]|nr:type II secretion system F family protein [Myxococcales bacterium]